MFRRKTTTLDLSKKDLTQIPFQLLASRCIEASNAAVSLVKMRAEQEYTKRVKAAELLAYVNPELGSDSVDGASEGVADVIASAEDIQKAKVNARTLVVSEFINEYGLKAKAAWLLPHMLSTFGTFKVFASQKRPELLSPTLTLNHALSKDPWLTGLYFLAMHSKRGDLVEAQYKAPNNNYCALVPLILAGIKTYQNIGYEKWDVEELEKIVDPKLYEAMICTVPDNLDAAELLLIRNEGLLTKTGTKAGEYRSVTSSYTLYGIQESEIGDCPWLAQVMLTQIWCANPANRLPIMVLDPDNWDNMPEPLVSTNILKKPVESIVVDKDFSWEV